MNCNTCNKFIPDDSAFCPFCGNKIIQEQKKLSEQVEQLHVYPVDTLIKRAFLFIEEEMFYKADAYIEAALNQDPENAQAYLGKLLIELRVKNQSDLINCEKPFDDSKNYQLILRFANNELIDDLNNYLSAINERLEKQAEEKRIADEKAYLEKQRQAEMERIDAERRSKRNAKIALITAPVFLITLTFILVLNCFIIPNNHYNTAVDLMNNGEYDKAIHAFQDIIDFKDSASKINECKYSKALAWMSAGNLEEAYKTFTNIEDYKDSAEKAKNILKEQLKNTKSGDCIKFGSYEQDNNSSNGAEAIEWIVLEIKDNKALIISKYALDYKSYNITYKYVTWENSSVRQWLNSSFLNTAFSDYEKTKILITTVSPDKNPAYDTYQGNATQDQIFLLSSSEAGEYFNTTITRECTPTAYAVENGDKSYNSEATCRWWLRSSGSNSHRAVFVSHDGMIKMHGEVITNDTIAVRPALWIDLSD